MRVVQGQSDYKRQKVVKFHRFAVDRIESIFRRVIYDNEQVLTHWIAWDLSHVQTAWDIAFYGM